MALPPIYKIHPAIGIARLGSAATFFIGPETPGLRPTGERPGTAVPPYKAGGDIKPQAARFRIWEYVDKGGQYVANREITLDEKDVTALQWTVHLANKKASFFKFSGMTGDDRAHPAGNRRNDSYTGDRSLLNIDPRPRSITGRNAKPVEFRKGTSANPASERWPSPAPTPALEFLGKLLTDDKGRLLVIGGKGIAASWPGATISSYANNDGWFDDVSDGPVTVHLEIKKKVVAVASAWVICGPPDFAPHLTSVVTLYDLLFDIAARVLPLPTNEAIYKTGPLSSLGAINAEFKKAGKPVLAGYKPNFNEEIYPILARAAASSFLAQQAIGHHSSLVVWAQLASTDPKNAAARQAVLAWVREPDAKPSNNFPYMPKLLGDEPYKLPGGVIHQHVRLTLTPTQYALLQQWVKGNFVPSTTVPPAPLTKPNITPAGLDRAALENCVGGAFFPGIEVGWQIRAATLYLEPFRIKHGAISPYRGDGKPIGPGYFTRQMALPWQADFLQCKSENDGSGAFPNLGLWGWWPAQRPDGIFPTEADFKANKSVPWHRATKAGKPVPWPSGFSGNTTIPSYQEMLANWRKFGFIVEQKKNIFLEAERESDIP